MDFNNLLIAAIPIVGTLLLRGFDWFVSKRKEAIDAQTTLMAQYKADSAEYRKRCDDLETEKDNWKSKYFEIKAVDLRYLAYLKTLLDMTELNYTSKGEKIPIIVSSIRETVMKGELEND